MEADPSIIEDALQGLLDASEKIMPSSLYSKEVEGFRDDLIYMQLRRILVKYIEQVDGQGRALAIKLLFRWGKICGSAEDLLIAAQL